MRDHIIILRGGRQLCVCVLGTKKCLLMQTKVPMVSDVEEPFVVLGTVILCERGRELEVSCVVHV